MGQQRRFSRKNIVFVLKVIISIILISVIFYVIGIGKVIKEFSALNPVYLIISSSLGIIILYLKAARWKVILQVFNSNLDIKSSMVYTVISYSFGIVTPGRLGEFIRAKFVADKLKLGYLQATITIIIDKIFDALAVVLFVFIGLFYLKSLAVPDYAGILIAAYVFFLLFIMIKPRTVADFIIKPFSRRFTKKFSLDNLNSVVMVKAMAFSIVSWLVFGLQAFLIAYAMKINIGFIAILTIVPLMALSSMLPISIGGLGVREIVTIYFLLPLGITAEKAAVFSLLYTFASLGMLSIAGAILYGSKKHLVKRID